MELLGSKKRRRLRVLIPLALVSTLVLALGEIPALAEYFFARGVTRFLSGCLNLITNYISFSFYELTAVLLIVGGVALAVGLVFLLCKRQWKRLSLWLYRLALAALCVLLAFGVLYAPLYSRGSVLPALGLSDTEISREKLYAAAEFYVERLNRTSEQLERDEEGNVIPTSTFSELSARINEEYGKLQTGYFAEFEVRAKEVALSVPMSYLGITGIYFPFYAEANVNVNIPPYELPVTMAHEIAHAKGVSQEGEANVAAYVLCIRADDAYLNYSGLMRAVASLLNSLPQEEYEVLYDSLSEEVKREYRNANAHYAKYEGAIDAVSSFFNDIFLKANGVAGGTRSYSQTAASLVSLYEQLAFSEQ